MNAFVGQRSFSAGANQSGANSRKLNLNILHDNHAIYYLHLNVRIKLNLERPTFTMFTYSNITLMLVVIQKLETSSVTISYTSIDMYSFLLLFYSLNDCL